MFLSASSSGVSLPGLADSWYRVAFENAPIGMCVMAPPDDRFVAVNEALCRLLGRSAEDLLGLRVDDVTHPDDLASTRERRRLRMGGMTREERVEKRYLRADGTVVWAAVSSTLVRGLGGEPLYTVGEIEDIDGRKRAEAQRRWSEARYRDLVENASDAIYTADIEGNLTSVNPAATRISGYSEEELLTMNYFDLVAPDQVALAREVMERVIAEGKNETVELALSAKDGHRVWVEGECPGFCVLHDRKGASCNRTRSRMS